MAIVSRVGREDVVRGIDGAPGSPKAGAVSAICDGLWVVCVYADRRVPGSDHYESRPAVLAGTFDIDGSTPTVASGPSATQSVPPASA